MAAIPALTGHVLLRIGDGLPVEVSEFPVPLRGVLQRDDVVPGKAHITVQVDLVTLHEGLRAALLEAADAVPSPPGDDVPDLGDERQKLLANWRAFREARS